MATKSFPYQVRHVRNGEIRLVAYYSAYPDQRPAAIILPVRMAKGETVDVQFVTDPATQAEATGD